MTHTDGSTITNPWAGAHYMDSWEAYLARKDEKRKMAVLAIRTARTLKTGN